MNVSHRSASASSLQSDAARRARLQLLKRLQHSDQLLDTLITSSDYLSELLPCDAVAATLDGEARGSDPALAPLARHLADTLAAQDGNAPCLIQRLERPVKDLSEVLAIRFDAHHDGWLFWFRKPDASRSLAWRTEDLTQAERLRTDLLELRLTQMQQTVAAQRRWISALGHSLYNPLQSIGMSVGLLHVSGDRNLDLQQHIRDASQRMQALIRRTLEVNRLHEGERINLSLADCDLSALIHERLIACQPNNDTAQSHLDIPTGMTATLDTSRCSELLDILLNNAFGHRRRGTPVSISLSEADRMLCLQVANQTSEQNLPLNTLFNPHSHAEGPLHRSGLGISLYLAREIARAHGGSLQAEQNEETLCFVCCLPRAIN
ncbi:MAG: ATP-binding protein [Halopseudomonas sp.]|uniref:GAF domain-containing sensor histidine kinase n=1 Tax=Halopseudomonas sp. TaxID=2901191 RepID=UPI0030037FDF